MSKRKTLAIVFSVITLAALLLIVFLQQRYVAPIIMYHSVSPKATHGNMLAVTPGTFERQMSFLKRHHYNVVSLEELVSLIRDKKKIPAKTIAITFDDGYKNNYEFAFPILKKYNLPASIFVIVNEIGRPKNDRLSWGEIMAMQDSGLVTIGSHALDPEPLINLKSDDEIKNQLYGSKKILEDRLGRSVNIFSYPEGLFNVKIRQFAIDAGYSGCVTTSPGRDYPDDDIFALKRLRISENAANMFVFSVETSGFYTFMKESKKKKHGKK